MRKYFWLSYHDMRTEGTGAWCSGSVRVAQEANTPQLAVPVLNPDGIQTGGMLCAVTALQWGGGCCGFKAITESWSSHRHLLCSRPVRRCQGALASFEDQEGAVFILRYCGTLFGRGRVSEQDLKAPREHEEERAVAATGFLRPPCGPWLCFGWEGWVLPELNLGL